MTASSAGRPSRIEIDASALRANAAALVRTVAPSALCAAVKANGYGHGAVTAARAAVDGGAAWLAVATIDEGRELRSAGLDVPILLLSDPAPDGDEALIDADLVPVVSTVESGQRIGAAARRAGRTVRAHLKVDTGMHRVGATVAEALAVADALRDTDGLFLDGVCTHLARADEDDPAPTDRQLDAFREVLARLRASGHRPTLVHAANSAGSIRFPSARFDMCRCGIALYGIRPAVGVALPDGVAPALRLVSAVSAVRSVAAGESVGYGGRFVSDAGTTIATVPVGYGDGVPRSLGLVGGEVLIDGRRRPIAGVVSMDQLTVATNGEVAVGDEVVLLGAQRGERITPEDWAAKLGTIGYEIVCGLSARLPRVVVAGPADSVGR